MAGGIDQKHGRTTATIPEPDQPKVIWRKGQLLFDRYRVEGLLGRGGMGEVYRVYYPAWQHEMAVKRLPAELTGDVRSTDRFLRECQTWADLDLHPHIATCYFIRKLDDCPLIFMECLDGGSLEAKIADGHLYNDPAAGLQQILDIGIQVAWGLGFAHRARVIHQDVKPANVLLTRFGTAKVADFGLARARQAIEGIKTTRLDNLHVATSGMTPAFASPEQANGEQVSPASDVWSWALTVFAMFTGSVNWRSGAAAPVLLNAVEKQTLRLRLPLPDPVRDVLRRCFVKEPDKRLCDLNEVADELIQLYYELTGAYYFREPPDAARAPGNPRHVASLNNRAISLVELDAAEKAYKLLSNAQVAASVDLTFEKMPELQDVAFNRVLLQIRTNPLFDAKEAPNLVPPQPDATKHLYLVGLLLLKGGELDTAIDFLGKVITSDTRYRNPALVARAVALLLKGESKPALHALRFVQKSDDAGADVLRLLALAEYFDGRSIRALKLFERAAASTIPGARLHAEYAILLARCGLVKSAAKMGERALKVPHRDTEVLLHTAELCTGSQTFLPSLAAVPAVAAHPRALALECLNREPRNLRAAVDAATLPQRFPLRLRATASWRRRVMPEASDPATLLSHALLSHEALIRNRRWGKLAPSTTRTVAMFIAAAIAIVVTWNQWSDLFQTPFLTATNSPTGRLSALARIAGLWTILGAVFARPLPAERLIPSLLLMCVALPASLWLPSLAHNWFLRHAAGVEMPSLYEQFGPFLGRFVLTLAALFLVREFIFQRLSARLRAFGSFKHAFSIDVLKNAWSHRLWQFKPKTSPWHTQTQTALVALLASWPSRTGPQLRLRYEQFRAKFGLWQFALLPEILVLAIADTVWLSHEPQIVFGYFLAMFAAHVVLLFWLALAPRFSLLTNIVLIPIIVLLLTAEFASAATLGAVLIAAFLFVLLQFFNLVAILYCPEFAPLVRGPLKGWDLQCVIDPMNLRDRVVFWRLLSGENATRPSSSNGLNQWNF